MAEDDLSTFMDRHSVGYGFAPNLLDISRRSRGSRSPVSALRKAIADDNLAAPLVAATFWQSALYSGVLHVDEAQIARSTVLVVRHGYSAEPRYSLLILDPEFDKSRPISESLRTGPSASYRFDEGWHRFQSQIDLPWRLSIAKDPYEADLLRLLWHVGGDIVRDLAYMGSDFRLVVAPVTPQVPIVLTSGPPDSLMRVNGKSGSGLVGVVAKNGKGVLGVTASHHVMDPTMTTSLVGREVEIDGAPRVIVSDDITTDSIFIEHSSASVPRRNDMRPMTGLVPRVNETVTFNGTQGKVQTVVLAHTFELPWWHKGNQSRVFTKPDTLPGDSGAALLDEQDRIIGFAHGLSSHNVTVPHSDWIWGQAVYVMHDLS